MRTINQCLGVLVLVLGLCGISWAISFEHEIDFTEPEYNNILTGTGTFSWTHLMPSDFSIPPYEVTSASLQVTAQRASNGNDFVYIFDLEEPLGALNASGNSEVTTTFNLGTFNLAGVGIFNAGWEVGQNLNLYLDYIQGTNINSQSLTMLSSVFTMTYESAFQPPPIGSDPAPVPEPGTLLLLGGGLAGLALYRRKQKKV